MGYKISSQSSKQVVIIDAEKGKVHKINLTAMSCDCKGFIFHRACSHLNFVAKKLGLAIKVKKQNFSGPLIEIEKNMENQFKRGLGI